MAVDNRHQTLEHQGGAPTAPWSGWRHLIDDSSRSFAKGG